jgi:hypothetical protein
MHGLILKARTLWIGTAVGLLGGCAATEEVQQLKDQNEKFRLQLVARDDLYKELLTEMKTQVQTLQRKTAELERKLAVLEVAPPPMGDVGTAPVVAQRSSPQAMSRRLPTLLTLLKDPTFLGMEGLKQELEPQASDAATLLLAEVSKDGGNVQLAERVEDLISAFAATTVRPALEHALKNEALRLLATRIIRRNPDSSYAAALADHLSTPDDDFQFSLGLALVRCQDKRGIPVLIRSLGSPTWDRRTLAIHTLREVNAGEDFSYNPLKSTEENATAIAAWNTWWDTFKEHDLLR